MTEKRRNYGEMAGGAPLRRDMRVGFLNGDRGPLRRGMRVGFPNPDRLACWWERAALASEFDRMYA
jgi:hypothetical protein